MMSNEYLKIPLQRLSDHRIHIESEYVVQESIISLYCRGLNEEFKPYTTLLGTPSRINELHAGHLLCEGLVSDLPSTTKFEYELIDGKVHSYYNSKIQKIPENRMVTTSCGACNHPDLSVDQIQNKIGIDVQQWTHHQLLEALNTMRDDMKLFTTTGGCHGAGFLESSGDVVFVAEDIGRHNAVDKSVGIAINSGVVSFNQFTLLLSGRCGWDIVAKAARIGISSIASVGAFSSAALDLARDNGITLYGFVRESGTWKAGKN